MTNISGDIQLLVPQQGFVPATSALAREHYGRTDVPINLTEGRGRHPRVKIAMNAVALGMVSVNMLSAENAMVLLTLREGVTSDINALGLSHTSALLQRYNSGRDEIFYALHEGLASVYGDCVAASSMRTVALKPDPAPDDWQALNIRIKGSSDEGYLGLARLDVVVLPNDNQFFGILDEKPSFTPITVTNLQTVCLASLSRVTLMLEKGKRWTVREKALVSMGMAVETYKGERPSGIRFAPKVETLES